MRRGGDGGRKRTYNVATSLQIFDFFRLECGHGYGFHSMAKFSADYYISIAKKIIIII
jgi:hypothetical protein